MGGCAGVAGPQRQYRQTYQSKLRNSIRGTKKQLNPAPGNQNNPNIPNAPKGADNKTLSSIDIRKSQNPHHNLTTSASNRNSLTSHILIKDREQKENNPHLSGSRSQYQTLRETDLRNSGVHNNSNHNLHNNSTLMKETHSRFETDQMKRLQILLEKSVAKDQEQSSLDRMMILQNSQDRYLESPNEKSMIRSHTSSDALNSNVVPYNHSGSTSAFGLTLKKKGELQIIQQLINEDAKTPQYIQVMREQNGEDIEDIQIDICGELPSVPFRSIYSYLKDLECLDNNISKDKTVQYTADKTNE